MKKVNRYKVFAGVCALALLGSCDYEDINTNPYEMTEEMGKMDGIAEYFAQKLKITANTFDEPQLAAVIGAGVILSDEHLTYKAATQD